MDIQDTDACAEDETEPILNKKISSKHLRSFTVRNTDFKEVRTLKEMTDILLDVVKVLVENGDVDLLFLTFFRHVKEESFPLTNIALLLWLEVVLWFENKTATFKSYSDQAKSFWKI